MPETIQFVIFGAAALVLGVIGFIAGSIFRRKSAEKAIGSAEDEAKRILSDAMKTAETRKKETLIEAKEEIHQLRQETERDLRERRAEVQRQEHRIQQKEETLDRKTDNLEAKEEKLAEKAKVIEAKIEECEQLKRSQLEMLEKISGLSKEQAKAQLLSMLEGELTHEKAVKIMEFEQQTKEESEKLARELLGHAIQRCAADHSSEMTVSVVALPNDEMKGRIIGREGRNIRAIENATGVDLIIDDTPEAITVSSFEPIRREIARVTLEKLIVDGRIHPARIEETVAKATAEVEAVIKQEGERAMIESGVHNLHPELVKLLGRLHFRTSYGQNVLNHSLEVCHLSGLLAAELGVDVTLAKRAGLLHDIGKAIDHEQEGSHIQLGVEAAKKYRETDAVIHAIHAHHGDIEAKTVIACIVQAADAISAARPGARRENIENYIKRLEKLEEIANSFGGVEDSYAIQAGREIRIIVKPEVVSDDQMVIIARDIATKIENELEYPGQIKVNLIRENRAIDYAK
ncbi:MAG: ribonuclease Y [Clostridia bacterium]|nr:ribonuclease Y [Clostridia bacterium]MEE0808996.1 ribonuclease Y [Acutalibacteraceae bacterium]